MNLIFENFSKYQDIYPKLGIGFLVYYLWIFPMALINKSLLFLKTYLLQYYLIIKQNCILFIIHIFQPTIRETICQIQRKSQQLTIRAILWIYFWYFLWSQLHIRKTKQWKIFQFPTIRQSNEETPQGLLGKHIVSFLHQQPVKKVRLIL